MAGLVPATHTRKRFKDGRWRGQGLCLWATGTSPVVTGRKSPAFVQLSRGGQGRATRRAMTIAMTQLRLIDGLAAIADRYDAVTAWDVWRGRDPQRPPRPSGRHRRAAAVRLEHPAGPVVLISSTRRARRRSTSRPSSTRWVCHANPGPPSSVPETRPAPCSPPARRARSGRSDRNGPPRCTTAWASTSQVPMRRPSSPAPGRRMTPARPLRTTVTA